MPSRALWMLASSVTAHALAFSLIATTDPATRAAVDAPPPAVPVLTTLTVDEETVAPDPADGLDTRAPNDARPRPAPSTAQPPDAPRPRYVMTYEKMGDIDALHAQMASWDPRYVKGKHTPRLHVDHPEELPSRRVPASVIARVVQAHAGSFQVCRTTGLPRSAAIPGEVDVSFIIAADGQVVEPRDTGGAFADEAVRRCVVSTFGTLRFTPTPTGEPQTASYALTWSAQQ
jgi:hypothetical protein